jgi:hypothetical protein
LDLNESSQLCVQSLFVRSKPSPLRTWLQKWKRDSWSQHLYGRILKPSLGKAFETEWTSLLEATPANHSPQQESEQERKTQDTCGLGSQTEFGFCDQECASSRMSKDTSALDSAKSLESWNQWVTKCRGEYSVRVKSAHRTRGNGYSSWPTAEAFVQRGPIRTIRTDSGFRLFHGSVAYGTKLSDAVICEQMSGHPAPANPSTDGSRQESWPTARSLDGQVGESLETWEARRQRKAAEGINLHRPLPIAVEQEQRKQWATPRGVFGGNPAEWDRKSPNTFVQAVMEEPTGSTQSMKLNPRWVEALMGLPIGWTMPSCTRPVIIAPMNCDCLETESSQPPQNEHLEH